MDVRLPRLGEGADTGVIATMFVKEGDTVKKDQAILELESEKAVATIPSPFDGTVLKLFVKEGDEVKVGSMLLTLTEGAVSAPAPRAAVIDASVGDESPEEGGPGIAIPPDETEYIPAPVPALAFAVNAAEFPLVHPAGAPPPASPSIRKMARELSIDLYRVPGSERGGRIVMADLRAYVQKVQKTALAPRAVTAAAPAVAHASPAPQAKPAAAPVDFSKWGSVEKKKMSLLRKAISAKMTESWTTVPHITQFDEIDATGILALRSKYAAKYEKKGAHLTLTSFALKAAVATLKKHPVFNASIDLAAGEIIYKSYYNIGIAVDTEQGLIVPVLRDVDKKSLLEVSAEMHTLAERTRQRKVALEEMQGGTFTISNQGGIGSAHFTPIVNTPEVAILGIGRGSVKPVVRKGKVVQRTMVPIVLSYDHRIIDGANAARFMVDLVAAFESFKESDVRI
jgi:pyruvate dehydrogenase E2 component (dihydrolipoamide acetyltransferase)